jgi:hypothetical protein
VPMNIFRYLPHRSAQVAGLSSPVSMPIDARQVVAIGGDDLPSGWSWAADRPEAPSCQGCSGRGCPHPQAIKLPICWSATRIHADRGLAPRLAAAHRMTWRIPGSFSGPADAWDDAPGTCWTAVVRSSSAFLSSFLSHRARWLLLHLDLDVGSRPNAVSHNGLLGRRTYDFAVQRRMWRRARDRSRFPVLSISERPAAVSAGVVGAKNWLSTLTGQSACLHLDQTRLTRLDLSCPRCLHKVSHRSFPPIYAVSGKGVFGSC